MPSQPAVLRRQEREEERRLSDQHTQAHRVDEPLCQEVKVLQLTTGAAGISQRILFSLRHEYYELVKTVSVQLDLSSRRCTPVPQEDNDLSACMQNYMESKAGQLQHEIR